MAQKKYNDKPLLDPTNNRLFQHLPAFTAGFLLASAGWILFISVLKTVGH